MNNVRILAFGDSITAGYQLPPQQAYPQQLEALLRAEGYRVDVTNAGVSGDTTAQALARVEWNLKQGHFDVVLLEIGPNDGLRQMSLEHMEKNIHELVKRFKATGAKVVLMGMRLPSNFDAKYRTQFEKIYPRVAKAENIPVVPWLLAGVATDEMLNLEDQVHPNAKGYSIIARNVAVALKPLLGKPPS